MVLVKFQVQQWTSHRGTEKYQKITIFFFFCVEMPNIQLDDTDSLLRVYQLLLPYAMSLSDSWGLPVFGV